MIDDQLAAPPEVAPQPRLPFARIADVAKLPEGERWLVDGLLTRSSIMVLAAAPKTGKTWVALAIAVGVASGTPVMGRFLAPVAGPVLLFPAEDDPRSVRGRIEAIALGAGTAFDTLPIHIITADQLRLDDATDREKLEELLEHLRPRLLVLDPLVRLHSGAESYVGHVSELFRYLRSLQRRFEVAILLTHHVAKNRTGAGPGQAMRGSGDIHAAYDHGAGLQRLDDGSVLLTLEHRSAPSPEPVAFRLHSREDGATLFGVTDGPFEDAPQGNAQRHVATAVPRPTDPALHVRDQVLALLAKAGRPLSQVAIRKTLRVRNETLADILRELASRGALQNLGRMGGWHLTPRGQAPSA